MNNIIIKLNLRKYKKSYISLFIVIILACTFTLSITIFDDSLIKTEEQQRKDIYGNWHISVYNTQDSLFQDLQTHGTIKSIGKMTGYGNVIKSNDEAAGVIGSVDDKTVQMGLSLMDGSFPVKDNEIAVEMSYLTMLGISYEIGQTIPLRIQVYDYQRKKYIEVHKDYILSGVLKNYSSLWKTDGNQLISFLVTDTSLQTPPLFEHVFCTLKKEYVNNADELSLLTMNRGSFIKNDYTYFEYASKNKIWYESFLSGSVLVLIVTLTSAFFILNIFYTSLKEHNKSFVVMRSLGASKYEITVLYCKELLFVLSIAFAAGNCFGLLVSYIGFTIIKSFMIPGFILYISALKLMFLLLTIILFVLLFAIVSVFRIGKMPLMGSIKLQLDTKAYHKHRRKFKPLTIRNMVRIFNNAHRKESMVYFLLTTGTFLILAGTAYRSYQKYQEYSFIKNTYTEDYVYGVMPTYMEPKNHIDKDEVEHIKKIYGIDYVRAYQCSDYLPISWEGMEKSEYAEYFKYNFFPQYTKNPGVNATVFGLSDNVKDYQFYVDEIDKGNISKDDFLSGSEVILYLPVYYKSKNGQIFNKQDMLFYSDEFPSARITDDSIKVGDKIIIKGNKGDVTVKVAGIINDFKDNSSQSFLYKPYSVICNEILYNKLSAPDDIKNYEYLQIYANKNANYERTDVEISKISDNLNIQNLRMQKENARYDALVSIVISLLLNFIAIFIVASIQYNNQIAKIESDYWRNHILSVLGMDKSKIQLLYLYNILKNSVIAILIGFIAIYFYQAVIYLKSVKGLLAFDALTDFCKYIFNTYFMVLPLLPVCLFVIGYIVMNVVIAYYPIKRYRKIK